MEIKTVSDIVTLVKRLEFERKLEQLNKLLNTKVKLQDEDG